MNRPQFEIRSLLGLTAIVGCFMTFVTQTSGWLVAFLVTVLLTNVLAVIVAMFVYVIVPIFENRSAASESADAE